METTITTTSSLEEQPLEVIRRVKALKKLQFENIKHEVRRARPCRARLTPSCRSATMRSATSST